MTVNYLSNRLNLSIPAGVVQMYVGSTAPTGYLLCDGTAISRTTYASLFAVIGTTYGTGDGSTTFNLPDMRGASPAGAGTSTGYTQNETIALGTKYNDQSQGHKHDSSGGVNSYPTAYATDIAIGSVNGFRITTAAQYSGLPATDGTNGTPRTGTVTRGKRVGINFIIKY